MWFVPLSHARASFEPLVVPLKTSAPRGPSEYQVIMILTCSNYEKTRSMLADEECSPTACSLASHNNEEVYGASWCSCGTPLFWYSNQHVLLAVTSGLLSAQLFEALPQSLAFEQGILDRRYVLARDSQIHLDCFIVWFYFCKTHHRVARSWKNAGNGEAGSHIMSVYSIIFRSIC